MAEINLLPTNLRPTSGLARLANGLRIIDIVLFVLFLLFVSALIGLFVINSLSLRDTLTSEEQLKNSIKSLKATEQKLVLVRDRIEKADQILSKGTAVAQVEKLGETMVGLGPVTLVQSEMKEGRSEMSFSAPTSSSLKDLLTKLKGLTIYGRIVLNSLSFTPSVGYSLDIVASDK